MGSPEGGPQDVTRTVEGTVLGTAAYMSPEQAKGEPLDARSDVFCFGAVLYQMLSGTRAFAGHTSAQVVSAVIARRSTPAPDTAFRAWNGIVRLVSPAKQPAAAVPGDGRNVRSRA